MFPSHDRGGWNIIYSPFDQINVETDGYPTLIVLPFRTVVPVDLANVETSFNYDDFLINIIFAGLQAPKSTDANSFDGLTLLNAEWIKAHQFLNDLRFYYEVDPTSVTESNVISEFTFDTSHEFIDANAAIGVLLSFRYRTINTIDYC